MKSLFRILAAAVAASALAAPALAAKDVVVRQALQILGDAVEGEGVGLQDAQGVLVRDAHCLLDLSLGLCECAPVTLQRGHCKHERGNDDRGPHRPEQPPLGRTARKARKPLGRPPAQQHLGDHHTVATQGMP